MKNEEMIDVVYSFFPFQVVCYYEIRYLGDGDIRSLLITNNLFSLNKPSLIDASHRLIPNKEMRPRER